MTRQDWVSYFKSYGESFPQEKNISDIFEDFVEQNSDCFERTNTKGHLTASALVFDPVQKKILLTHHRKLNKWLQLGGHADGEADLSSVAQREVEEESGLKEFRLYSKQPIDIDCHEIPTNPKEQAHNHLDVRYLVLADANQPFVVSDESHDLKWFGIEEALNEIEEESLKRLIRKSVFEYEKYSGNNTAETH